MNSPSSNGWRIRRTVHGDLSGDIPFFLGIVVAAGAVLGAVAAFIYDHLAHQYRGTLR